MQNTEKSPTLPAPRTTTALTYRLILGRTMDLAAIRAAAAQDLAPGHVWANLQQNLNMPVHSPENLAPSFSDRLKSKIIGRPEHWALARHLRTNIADDDVLYCTGEDVGIPLAATLPRARRPRIVLCAHNLDRPRARLALKLFNPAPAVALWLAFSQNQAHFIRTHLHVPPEKICWIPERSETDFFTPGPQSPGKTRPIIAGIGLEQRDYHTLADACTPLPVDVRLSAFSADKKISRKHIPFPLPSNMSQKFYEWPALRQLYRDADVVVVPLFPCKYCAGITTYLEALACRRPVVMTYTQGMREYVDPPKGCRAVPAGDVEKMRDAIEDLLANPAQADALADQGYAMIHAQHTPAHWLQLVEERLRSI